MRRKHDAELVSPGHVPSFHVLLRRLEHAAEDAVYLFENVNQNAVVKLGK